ncbi:hypothetical protein MTO98_02170 [Mucilaginibacter sp. SMC90]|uniref:hypothetical protein n=1 Tax=Mucilaginibacter TaxID=423349 RepID=UPI00131D0C4C|nr:MULTISPECIES: hypothetical protein [unclassified Mucilaginibacter]UOE49876.1 hypothetical protein MTO98_02170 [Mucilaginibacter sp. SMC90]
MGKIAYKTYLNDRLKQADFHGTPTFPLYIQITYERKSIFFKSYYFQLLSKRKYLIVVPGIGSRGPSLEFVKSREEVVINYCIDKLGDNFSLDTFKELYDGMSTDLCDMLEGGFFEYLFNFFWDEGNPSMRDAIHNAIPTVTPYNLLHDFKRMFKADFYNKLIENSFYYAPPYLPLYGFKDGPQKGDPIIFSVMDWQDNSIKEKFQTYVEKTYPFAKANDVVKAVDTWAGKYLSVSSGK